MADMVTWDNVRFNMLFTATTDVNGFIQVDFSPAFPNVCHGVACSMDISGGNREWLFGISGLNHAHFFAGIADPTGAPVVGVNLGIHYLAFGE